MKKWAWLGVSAIIIIFISISSVVHFITDFMWFDHLTFGDVYWKVFTYKSGLWAFTLIFYFLIIYLNFRLALSFSNVSQIRFNIDLPVKVEPMKVLKLAGLVFIGFISFTAAGASSSSWETVIKYFHSTEFQQTDPIFNNDISFYFFRLPLVLAFKKWLFSLSVLSLLISAGVYVITGALRFVKGWQKFFSGAVKTHISILLLIIAALFSLDYWLKQYELLYSDSGVVFGAGYADVSTRMFAYKFMSFMSIVLAGFIIYSVWKKGILSLIIGLSSFVGASIIIVGIVPTIQQKFIVEPNELEKETPYIKHNIEYTRKAYAIDEINRSNYKLTGKLSKEQFFSYKDTIQNIRLWDVRPLLSTYKQIQEIRLYYQFKDVDIGRYMIDGRYKQIMLSPRELSYSQVPAQAKTWVNQRLKYTHGYGVVASPVDTVTPEGLPHLYLKDIPPRTEYKSLKVKQPAIYYGEETNHYIFTGATTDEFDYPLGDKNQLVRYSGKGGVELDSVWKRLAYAVEMSSIKVLISSYLKKDTKIHYYRNIKARINRIAPFLHLDSDPYVVIADGRLKWVVDGYTMSSRYPYAMPLNRSNINYIRSAVKIVVDAYDGDVKLYISDAADPIIQTYQKIFPSLFLDIKEAPKVVSDHFRYPLDYFSIQASMYLTYHMTDPEVFYNREDMWKFPKEIYEGRETRMEPYYTIMQLGGGKAEFLLILPFTPKNKNNMIAWMAVSSDGDNYGKLTVYEFPKKELIYGPLQIEARIDQDPEISEVLTLWNQQGSSVIRGNLLVIPLAGSLIYVEPLYLQAEASKMPELKRVIVAYGNDIVMKKSLDEALSSVFTGRRFSGKKGSVAVQDLKSLIREAFNTHQRGKSAMKDGNWTEYGKAQKDLEQILKELQSVSPKK